MKFRLTLLLCLLLALIGCGRKLPPEPAVNEDPLTIERVSFTKSGAKVRVRVNAEVNEVILLGKAKGICPACTDDLVRIAAVEIDETGVVTLLDEAPASTCMVYRAAFEAGDTLWFSNLKISCK